MWEINKVFNAVIERDVQLAPFTDPSSVRRLRLLDLRTSTMSEKERADLSRIFWRKSPLKFSGKLLGYGDELVEIVHGAAVCEKMTEAGYQHWSAFAVGEFHCIIRSS